MIKIAICDDNEKDITITNEIVKKFFESSNIDFEIRLFTSARDLLNNAASYQMIFLDIELKDANGIEIAKHINHMNYEYKLFLVSGHTEYLKDGYKVKAERYFTKPIDYNEFKIDMQEVIQDYIRNSSFILDPKVVKQKIYIKDILYVEILARKTYLHTKNKTYITPYTLSYWKDVLQPYCFSQSHKAFYVNLQNVEDYNHQEIYMNQQQSTIPLSRFYKDHFIDDYIHFISNNI
ncbi:MULTISPECIES: LytR/AlgR family response regulator transcription factor [unclassified Amedibacterium]|jgi:DNA-binding LytR/AlgR family response regulator|uniref:LytR/AlgR family response regulator transcription factor n=1 Tax=unclassified Amedibacterium TaxID=3088137 RepID=UPI000E3F6881|nr:MULTISPECIES: LytTR family DNA-binding domain-containing protein [unclassified Absiella]RGB64970.1 DNA-binding response regulator [Absiella sp. AM09-45]RGB74124.1 DNA-binding response regulator [Absiella sp. AM09-50]RGC51852.1 DNA-binding response regulator [Absiella sp. AM29-15]